VRKVEILTNETAALISSLCRIAASAAVAITPALAADVAYNTSGSFAGASNV
jgi:hypothetical protein